MQKIYAIYDKRAQDILGNVILMRHDAAAARSFSDILNHPDNTLMRGHATDFDLICLGSINEKLQLETSTTGDVKEPRTVITGENVVALNDDKPQLKIG